MEFQIMYTTMLESLGLSFRKVVDSLDSIERLIYEQKVRIETSAAEAPEAFEGAKTPVVSDRAKMLSRSLSRRRTQSKLADNHVVAETPDEAFVEKTSDLVDI